MIRAVIIDDERHCTKTLEWEIKNHCPEVSIVAICNSGQTGLAAITEHKPDLVFLDIEMPRMNGFEMLNQLDTIDFEIIFTTAYDQFAIQAIRASALDYLLKPINKDELRAAIEKFGQGGPTHTQERWSVLFDQINSPDQKNSRIAIATHDGIELVQINDIISIQAESNYSTLNLKTGQTITVSKSLKHFEESLDQNGFFRPHHSYFINLRHVRKFVKSDGGYLLMSDKSTIPVSRRRKEDLVEILMDIH